MDLHKMLSLGLVFTICLVSAVNDWGFLQAPMTGALVPIATTNDMKYVPTLAYDSIHDHFLVVWEHVLPATGVHEIDGELVSDVGAVLQSFVISSDTNNELTPDVAFDTVNSRFLVVWAYDTRGDQSDFDIYGRLIPSAGPDSGSPETWIDRGAQSSVEPKVTYGLHPNAFLIVWKNNIYSTVSTTTPASISGALRHNEGSFAPFTVYSDDFMHGIDAPAVTYDAASNNFLVVWDVEREFTGWDSVGQRLGAAGQILGNEFDLLNSQYDDLHPSVTACPNLDMYLALNESVFPDNTYHGLGDIVLYGDGSVIVGGAGGAIKPMFWPPQACAPSGDRFQVTWAQAPNNADQLHILVYTEVIQPNSSASGYSACLDATDSSGDRVYPAIASGKLSSLVVWEQARSQCGFTDIYGRIIYTYWSFLPVLWK